MQRRAVGEAVDVRTKPPKQEGLDAGNPFYARARRGEQLITHCDFTGTKQVSEMKIGIGELPKRGFDDAACRVRSEAHNDDAKSSGWTQSDDMGLKVGRAFRRQGLRALMDFRQLSILTDQMERGARGELDCQRLCESFIWDIAVPNGVDNFGKRR